MFCLTVILNSLLLEKRKKDTFSLQRTKLKKNSFGNFKYAWEIEQWISINLSPSFIIYQDFALLAIFTPPLFSFDKVFKGKLCTWCCSTHTSFNIFLLKYRHNIITVLLPYLSEFLILCDSLSTIRLLQLSLKVIWQLVSIESGLRQIPYSNLVVLVLKSLLIWSSLLAPSILPSDLMQKLRSFLRMFSFRFLCFLCGDV